MFKVVGVMLIIIGIVVIGYSMLLFTEVQWDKIGDSTPKEVKCFDINYHEIVGEKCISHSFVDEDKIAAIMVLTFFGALLIVFGFSVYAESGYG